MPRFQCMMLSYWEQPDNGRVQVWIQGPWVINLVLNYTDFPVLGAWFHVFYFCPLKNLIIIRNFIQRSLLQHKWRQTWAQVPTWGVSHPEASWLLTAAGLTWSEASWEAEMVQLLVLFSGLWQALSGSVLGSEPRPGWAGQGGATATECYWCRATQQWWGWWPVATFALSSVASAKVCWWALGSQPAQGSLTIR